MSTVRRLFVFMALVTLGAVLILGTALDQEWATKLAVYAVGAGLILNGFVCLDSDDEEEEEYDDADWWKES